MKLPIRRSALGVSLLALTVIQSAQAQTFYFTDHATGNIDSVDSYRIFSVFAPGSNASGFYFGVTVDSAGNVYGLSASDQSGTTIKEFSPYGQLLHQTGALNAGGGVSIFASLGFDGQGHLYEANDSGVVKGTISGGLSHTFTEGNANQFTVDANENVYQISGLNILKWTPNAITPTILTRVPSAENGTLATDSSGNIYYVSSQTDFIHRLDEYSSSGQILREIYLGTNSSIQSNITGIQINNSGDIFAYQAFPKQSNSSIIEYGPSGLLIKTVATGLPYDTGSPGGNFVMTGQGPLIPVVPEPSPIVLSALAVAAFFGYHFRAILFRGSKPPPFRKTA